MPKIITTVSVLDDNDIQHLVTVSADANGEMSVNSPSPDALILACQEVLKQMNHVWENRSEVFPDATDEELG